MIWKKNFPFNLQHLKVIIALCSQDFYLYHIILVFYQEIIKKISALTYQGVRNMVKYTIKRILVGLLTLFVLVTLVFILMKVMPGGPFDSDRNTDPKVIAIIQERYNLDKPLVTQYLLYLKDIAGGDLGESFKKIGTTVESIIIRLSPVTIRLGAVALIVSLVFGTGFGITAALTKRKWLRGAIVAMATVGVSVPGFLMALFLIYFFSVELKLLPVIGLNSWKHYIMPSLALSFYPIAFISRMLRSVLTEVMQQDYITMAKAKGLKRSRIIYKHALKNALIPVITYMGPMIANLMTGSFVVETIFAIPGIGREFVASIQGRDYPVILGLSIFIGAFVIMMNLVVDIIMGLVDPRIKLDA